MIERLDWPHFKLDTHSIWTSIWIDQCFGLGHFCSCSLLSSQHFHNIMWGRTFSFLVFQLNIAGFVGTSVQCACQVCHKSDFSCMESKVAQNRGISSRARPDVNSANRPNSFPRRENPTTTRASQWQVCVHVCVFMRSSFRLGNEICFRGLRVLLPRNFSRYKSNSWFPVLESVFFLWGPKWTISALNSTKVIMCWSFTIANLAGHAEGRHACAFKGRKNLSFPIYYYYF